MLPRGAQGHGRHEPSRMQTSGGKISGGLLLASLRISLGRHPTPNLARSVLRGPSKWATSGDHFSTGHTCANAGEFWL